VAVASIPVGLAPQAAVYDPVDAAVDVLNSGSHNLTVVEGLSVAATIGLGSLDPTAGVFDPSDGFVLVVGAGGEAAAVGVTGVAAVVNMTGNPEAPAYDPFDGEIDVPDAFAGGWTVVSPSAYQLAFTESDLPNGSGWSVEVGGSTASTNGTYLAFPEPLGSYAFEVVPPVGYGASAFPSSPVTLANAGVTVSLTFSPEAPHTVTFRERGLPPGTFWCVTLRSTGCGNSTKLAFSGIYPGRYAYNVTPIPGYSVPVRGNVTVGSTSVTKTVRFAQVTYRLEFVETGLPTRHPWKVTVGHVTRSSTRTTLAFQLPNGTGVYAVREVSGWTTANRTGPFVISGAGLTVHIAFVPAVYAVTFVEATLPNGTNWSVAIGASVHWSNGTSTVAIVLPNGSYRYVVGPITGYRGPANARAVHVAGRAVTVRIKFRPITLDIDGPAIAALVGVVGPGAVVPFAVPFRRRPGRLDRPTEPGREVRPFLRARR